MKRTWLRHLCSLALIIGVVLQGSQLVFAGTLTSASIALSTNAPSTSANYTFTFTTASTSLIQRIEFQYATNSGGSTKPAGLNLASATLGTTVGLPGSWTLHTGSAGAGLLYIDEGTPQSVTSGTAITVPLDGITNPAIGDCDSATATLDDTCYVHIVTYLDNGTTNVDSIDIGYALHEDPTFSFQVDGVVASETHNGITTTADSSPTSLAIGHLQSGVVRYMAHKLTITTNAPHGYKVYLSLDSDISGSYGSNHFSPFGAVDATWDTPQNWDSPSGDTPNSDTGWIGANTSDTSVSGWGSASAKFGPVSSTPHIVSESSGPERSGKVVYVSFGIEVNAIQPADYYTGNINYDVQVTY